MNNGHGKFFKRGTILIIAGMVLVLGTYLVTEHLLRKQMLSPGKKKKVDHARLVEWMPAKVRTELQYRAKYLELQQACASARNKEDEVRSAYNLAVHTRDREEHNRLLLNFIGNPEYTEIPGIYLAYGRFLCDPDNPKRITVASYHDFLGSLKDPEQLYLAWRGGRDMLSRHRASSKKLREYLHPLLSIRKDTTELREYSGLLDDLARRTGTEIGSVEKRLKADAAFPGDDELLKKLRSEYKQAMNLKEYFQESPEKYNIWDYRNMVKRRNAFLGASGKMESFKAACSYLSALRNYRERDELAMRFVGNPEYRDVPGIRTPYSVLLYDKRNPHVITFEKYYEFLQNLKDPIERFYGWREGRDRLNKLKVSPEVMMEYFSPLLAFPEKAEFSDYRWFVNDLAKVFARNAEALKRKKKTVESKRAKAVSDALHVKAKKMSDSGRRSVRDELSARTKRKKEKI